LLATAPHGSREGGLGAEQAEAYQEGGTEGINERLHVATHITVLVESFCELLAEAILR
jgi:hypothetical protein